MNVSTPDDARTVKRNPLPVPLSPEEREELTRAAAARGYSSLSSYLRACALFFARTDTALAIPPALPRP